MKIISSFLGVKKKLVISSLNTIGAVYILFYIGLFWMTLQSLWILENPLGDYRQAKKVEFYKGLQRINKP